VIGLEKGDRHRRRRPFWQAQRLSGATEPVPFFGPRLFEGQVDFAPFDGFEEFEVAGESVGQVGYFGGGHPVDRRDFRGIGDRLGIVGQFDGPPAQIDLPRSDAPPDSAHRPHVDEQFFLEFTNQGVGLRFTRVDSAAWEAIAVRGNHAGRAADDEKTPLAHGNADDTASSWGGGDVEHGAKFSLGPKKGTGTVAGGRVCGSNAH